MKTTRGTRPGVGGVQLATTTWAPEKAPKADVVLVHGYAEHSQRYVHVAERMCAKGLRVHTMDLRGHGASTGVERGEIDSFDNLVTDVEDYVRDVRGELPLFVFGHSMGGLASVRLAERGRVEIDGLVAQGSALRGAESIPPLLVKVGDVLAKIAPGMRTIALDGTAICSDPAVVAEYDADPLNFRGKLTARTGAEMNGAMALANAEFARISVPILVLHGARDRLTDVKGSLALASGVSSTDVRLEVIPGAFHELHNEPDRDHNIDLVVDWLVAHAKAATAAS